MTKKEELLYWSLQAEEAGLCLPRVGNFSIKDREKQRIYITPSGQDRKKATVEDLSILSFSGEWLGGLKPSSEFQMHVKLYQERVDIGGIAHTHSHFGTVLSVWEKKIPAIVYEVAIFGGEVPVAPYARPGTESLAEIAAQTLKEADVCLLAHHGVLSVGSNLEDAYLKALYVEETAGVYYHALLLGNNPPVIELDEIRAWKYPQVK